MSDAGEIIGRLKIDASDWQAKLEEAKGEAESLRSVDPKIQVTADTAAAIAGLNAVSAGADKVAVAEERLRVATQGSDRATNSALLAQMRLADVQDKRGRTAYQVAAAEEALRVATERSDNAALKAIAAEDQLAAARRDAAKAALEEGAAADVAGNKTKNAAQGAVPWMGILVGSIAAVAPGIVAVGAAAIGLSGELTGLGAVGLLAFKGIQEQMVAGTSLGQQYGALFSGLTDDLSRLEQVAAAGVFSGLSSGVQALESGMRPLTTDVALLSTQLGGLLATSADTAVHAVAGFAPVLLASGTALQGFLHGIDSFTSSNGFTQFVNYTVARLPDVMHLIDATLGAVGGIFTALAPAGQSTLFMLSALMDLIRALAPTVGALMPTVIGLSDAIGGVALVVGGVLNALGPLAPVLVGTTAAFVGLSFAAKALAPAVLAAADAEGIAAVATRGLGAAVDIAMGPIGLAVIAAGLLASALATTGDGSRAAAAAQGDYTAALMASNGAIDEAIAKQVALKLSQDGTFDAGRKLGLGTELLTQAALGNAAAQTQVNQALTAAQPVVTGTTGRIQQFTASQRQANDAIGKVRTGIGSQNADLQGSVQQWKDVNSATKGATGAIKGTSAALTAQTPITATLTAAEQAQVIALRSVAEGFRTDTAAASTLGNTYDAVTIAVGGLIKALKASKGNLNEDTVAGAQNAQAFRTAVGDIKAHADAINADGHHAAAARAYTLEHARALEEQAIKAGADKTKVDALVGSLINVSKQHPVSKIDVQTAQFQAKVEAVRSQMSAINGLTSTVYVNAVASGVSLAQASIINRQAQMFRADGGTIGLANGGTAGLRYAADGVTAGWAGTVRGPGTAWNDMAGLYALANSEEVISNKRGQADWSRPFLKAINSQTVRTPAQLADMAGRGQHGPTTVITRNLEPHITINYPTTQDPVQAAQEATQYIQAYAGL